VIRSMTGFGRSDFEVEGTAFVVELRSVNHRHLDVAIRLPRFLAAEEASLRKTVQRHFARGKVEVGVSLRADAAPRAEPCIDREVAQRYLDFAEELARERGLPGDLPVASLLSLPGVARLVDPVLPGPLVSRELESALERALLAAGQMRVAEGEVLARDLLQRLERVDALGREIRERAGEVAEIVRERLRKRTQQLREETGLLDEARLHQEVVIAADRLDITEELVRLHSHVQQFRGILAGAAPEAREGTPRGAAPAAGGASGRAGPSLQPVGRRLDFLLQEMLREANTIGSKAGDAEVAHRVVDLKTELERIREQVQNIE